MVHEPGTPYPRTAEQVQAELERVRKEDPHGYARRASRLLRELKRVSPARHRYAKT